MARRWVWRQVQRAYEGMDREVGKNAEQSRARADGYRLGGGGTGIHVDAGAAAAGGKSMHREYEVKQLCDRKRRTREENAATGETLNVGLDRERMSDSSDDGQW